MKLRNYGEISQFSERLIRPAPDCIDVLGMKLRTRLLFKFRFIDVVSAVLDYLLKHGDCANIFLLPPFCRFYVFCQGWNRFLKFVRVGLSTYIPRF